MSAEWYVSADSMPRHLEARTSLRGAVEEYWKSQGFVFPSAFMHDMPLGFVSRHLATARYEDCAFILMAERAGLTPVWSTYVRDRFVTHSPVKGSYLLPRIVSGFSRRGFPQIRKLALADTQEAERERRRLNEITTREGSSVVAWHRAVLEGVYPGALVTDPSDIYMSLGGAKGYYPLLLSLAVAHGVLFEDFHGGESGEGLNRFTHEVFEPAFRVVEEIFGVPPLIVPLPWWHELGYYVAPHRVSQWREDRVILRDLLP